MSGGNPGQVILSAMVLLAFLGLAWAGIAVCEGELRGELRSSSALALARRHLSRYARRPVAYKHYDIVISRIIIVPTQHMNFLSMSSGLG